MVDARYEPPAPANGGKSRLSFRLRAVAPVARAPCRVELVLSPDRVPGLLSPGEGTFRAVLTAEDDEALLFAEGLRLDDTRRRARGRGPVGGRGRASFVFRTTFARRGEPTTPRLDDGPAVRLRAPRGIHRGDLRGRHRASTARRRTAAWN